MSRYWFEKGVTGEMLREIRATSKSPVRIEKVGSHAFIQDDRTTYVSITLRGSSKCRRRQARIMSRWFRESPVPI